MTIRILPPRLANQIAAGEVVERPASVIKELVENALDAGATQVEVQVDQGGHKRILVRDNGHGIAKDELQLALSRHATSKVSHLDDIESIATLGFRGEALASISSVSRLTLTSKTAEQTEAWLAYAEGREMQVQVKPAAHPNGTSIEVTDLFFNTPARRKFLRAEKTEFHHIDELIKRLAMARFDVGFRLVHNGKVIRNLAICKNDTAQLKRIGNICGQEFARQAVHLSSQSGDVELKGWLLPASRCGNQSPAQYTFINGRMIRDKVLTHAIRQAYSDWLAETSLSAYALYLTLPFSEVDVNVHPAKHEVRFSQARLVHDFVVQAVQQALQAHPVAVEQAPAEDVDPETGEIFSAPQAMVEPAAPSSASTQGRAWQPKPDSSYQPPSTQALYPNQRAATHAPVKEQTPSRAHWQSYDALMSPAQKEPAWPTVEADNSPSKSLLPFQCIAPHYAALFYEGQIYLLDVQSAEQQLQSKLHPLPWKGQPLLLPLSVPLATEQVEQWQSLVEKAASFGIEIHLHSKRKLILKSLPALLRQCDLVAHLDKLQQALAAEQEAIVAKNLLELSYHGNQWHQRVDAIVSHLMESQELPNWLHLLSPEKLVQLIQ